MAAVDHFLEVQGAKLYKEWIPMFHHHTNCVLGFLKLIPSLLGSHPDLGPATHGFNDMIDGKYLQWANIDLADNNIVLYHIRVHILRYEPILKLLIKAAKMLRLVA